MICGFLPVPMPDHDGGPKRDFLLISRNFRDYNGLQYLLKPADGPFDLPLLWFRRRPCARVLSCFPLSCFPLVSAAAFC